MIYYCAVIPRALSDPIFVRHQIVAILCQKYFGLSMPPNNVLKIVEKVLSFYLPSPRLAK